MPKSPEYQATISPKINTAEAIADQLKEKTDLAKLLDRQSKSKKEKNLAVVKQLVVQYLDRLTFEAKQDIKKTQIIEKARMAISRATEKGEWSLMLELTQNLVARVKEIEAAENVTRTRKRTYFED